MDAAMYHEGARRLQDRFDTRRLADRLVEVTVHTAFNDDDRAFIEGSTMGGRAGFVRVVDPQTLAFGNYDGNGMFRSLGNILVNPAVGLLFVDFERPRRVRVNGAATLHEDDPLLAEFAGAQLVVRVRAERIFPNCPRYSPRMTLHTPSPYAPAPGCTPPVPEWKTRPVFNEVLPSDDPARRGAR